MLFLIVYVDDVIRVMILKKFRLTKIQAKEIEIKDLGTLKIFFLGNDTCPIKSTFFVGKLIYLSHTRLYIAYTVSIAGQTYELP